MADVKADNLKRLAGTTILINFIKKHQRQTSANVPSGIIEKEAPLHVSNVALVQDGKPVKVGFKFLDDGRKVRFLKSSGEIIDR